MIPADTEAREAREAREAYVAKQEADLIKWAEKQNANRHFDALGYWPSDYRPEGVKA